MRLADPRPLRRLALPLALAAAPLLAGAPLAAQAAGGARAGAGPETAALHAEVRDERGDPVPGVRVEIAGVRPRATGRDGRVDLGRVPAGTHAAVLRGRGWADTLEVRVLAPATLLELRLPPRPAVALEGLVVTARALTPAEAGLLATGEHRYVITRRDIQRHAGAQDVQNVLREHVPGILVREYYYRNTRMVSAIRVSFRGRWVRVIFNGMPLPSSELARLSPHHLEQMVLYPTGYRTWRGPVLVMDTRAGPAES